MPRNLGGHFNNSLSSRPVSIVAGDIHSDTFSRHMEVPKPQKVQKALCGCHVDNFGHTGKADVSKLEVSSSFQANVHHSLHTGYLVKNKEKGHTLFRTRWDKIFVPPLPQDLVDQK
ncbi:uncharacterized protein TNCV_3705061 [Trichonephila clavipes]|nr:uncharacterized protein TNCV_3705061 [Trichonephila clavipes]